MEWLNELAMTGATTLVGAIATQAWQSARGKFLEVFKDKPGTDLARRLDRDAEDLQGRDPADQEQERLRMQGEWQVRLKDLLQDYPQAAEALQAWAEQVREQLPAERQTWVMNVAPRDHATAYAVQGDGTQNVHNNYGQGARPDQP